MEVALVAISRYACIKNEIKGFFVVVPHYSSLCYLAPALSSLSSRDLTIENMVLCGLAGMRSLPGRNLGFHPALPPQSPVVPPKIQRGSHP